MTAKNIDKLNIITCNTYINVCNFYNIEDIEDIYDELTFNDVIEANSSIEMYNINTGRIVLILCSASKYTQQNVIAIIKKVKKRLQLIITNNISHPRVVFALNNKFKKLGTDVCPQRFFLFKQSHKLKQIYIKKYTYMNISKQSVVVYMMMIMTTIPII